MTPADRAARAFNDELTVILSAVELAIAALPEGHPARVPLIDIEGAALRCVPISASLLAVPQ